MQDVSAVKETGVAGIKCWHCTEYIEGIYDFLPLRAWKDIDGVWHFEGPGYFHDCQCLRAFIEDRELHAPHREPQLHENLQPYCIHVAGLKGIPPPALSRHLLRSFGGPLDWDQWKRHSMEIRRVEAWKIEDFLRRERVRACTERVRLHHVQINHVPTQTNLPGETHVLDSYIDFTA